MAPSYFHRKIGEKYNQKKFLAVWLPSYLLYLPSNLKPKWHPWLETAPCGRFARGTLLLFLRFYLKLATLIIMGKFSCCVPGCTSNWRNSPNVKFHTLPTQPNVKETYVRLIRNATLKKDVLTQWFVEHIFQMEKISEPLTGIEAMTLRTLVECSNHWATKDIVARSSLVRTSDQCTEDHRFNISWGLRYMYFLCLMLVTCLHHFSIFQLFPVRSKVYVCLFSNPRVHAMPIQDSVKGKSVY